MSASVAIGEFSRLTHLSVKMLRHYHEISLLVPAEVDPATKYRRYGIDQVPAALLIARLRRLDVPLPDIARVVRAPDPDTRNALIAEHLRRMESELERTREIVGSLRRLLTRSAAELAVTPRHEPARRVIAIVDQVDRLDINAWCGAAFPYLYGELAAAELTPAGPAGACYDDAFFTEAGGGVTAYVPIAETAAPIPAAQTLPAGRFAVAVHHGPFLELDQTYAALGSHVAEHERLAAGPIREVYLAGPGDVTDPAEYVTELCWPIAG